MTARVIAFPTGMTVNPPHKASAAEMKTLSRQIGTASAGRRRWRVRGTQTRRTPGSRGAGL